MSYALQAMAWSARFDGTAKLVLLRLCDFADDDGNRVFPTVKRVAEDCGISVRTTQEALRRLESAGVLVMVRDADAGARRPREYRVHVPALASRIVPKASDEGCGIGTGATSARVRNTTPRGAASAPRSDHESGQETLAATDTAKTEPPKSDHVRIGDRIAGVTGWDRHPNWFGDYGRVIVWLKAGWSAELDILPTVERLMAGRTRRGQGPPRGLDYFESAIADAHASRIKPLPEGHPHGRRSDRQHRAPARAPGDDVDARRNGILDALADDLDPRRTGAAGRPRDPAAAGRVGASRA